MLLSQRDRLATLLHHEQSLSEVINAEEHCFPRRQNIYSRPLLHNIALEDRQLVLDERKLRIVEDLFAVIEAVQGEPETLEGFLKLHQRRPHCSNLCEKPTWSVVLLQIGLLSLHGL
jgi:hypothetical protein